MVVNPMDITIEDSETLTRICKDVNLTPKELIEGYLASLTLLHSTYERTKNEGTPNPQVSGIASVGQSNCIIAISPIMILSLNKRV